jgi:hypothetical protein
VYFGAGLNALYAAKRHEAGYVIAQGNHLSRDGLGDVGTWESEATNHAQVGTRNRSFHQEPGHAGYPSAHAIGLGVSDHLFQVL